MGWDTAQPGLSPEPLTAHHGRSPNLEELIFCNLWPSWLPHPFFTREQAEQVKECPLPQVPNSHMHMPQSLPDPLMAWVGVFEMT